MSDRQLELERVVRELLELCPVEEALAEYERWTPEE